MTAAPVHIPDGTGYPSPPATCNTGGYEAFFLLGGRGDAGVSDETVNLSAGEVASIHQLHRLVKSGTFQSRQVVLSLPTWS